MQRIQQVEAYVDDQVTECNWTTIKEQVDNLMAQIKNKSKRKVKVYVGRSNNPCRRENEHIKSKGIQWLLVLCCSNNDKHISSLEKRLIRYVKDFKYIKPLNQIEWAAGSKGEGPYWLYIGLDKNLLGYDDNCKEKLDEKKAECPHKASEY